MLYILVDDIVKARFFSCFQQADNIIYLTNKLSCFLFLRKKTTKRVILLTGSPKQESDAIVDRDRLSKTISVLNGRQTLEDAIQNYTLMRSSLFFKLGNTIGYNDTLIVFNGNHASAISTTDFFNSKGAKTLYAEISNLPDKMVFDPKGVNAQSILYSNPEVLDSLEQVPDAQHEAWVRDYILYKENPIPQSKINISTYFLLAVDDIFTRIFKRIIKEDSLSFLYKVRMFRSKFKSRKILSSADHADLNQPYVFFPTQVTSDTQLKINSDIDNLQAISIILEREKDIDIYVKIHPAESNIDTINYFLELEKKNRIKIVSNNTIALIKHAKRIYTVNSTVGLEALIFEKELTVLGRAIYSSFDKNRLRLYIHRYLMDLNYFGDNILTERHFDKLTKLSEL